MKKDRLVDAPKIGYIKITDDGLALLKEKPDALKSYDIIVLLNL